MTEHPTARLPLTAAVLAGGRSVRMGVDKTLLDVGGRALVARVVNIVGEVCAHTLVATNRPDALADAGLPADVRILSDEVAYQGPLGGLATGLAGTTDEWMLAVGADMPHLMPDIVRVLWELRDDADVVVPVTAKGTEPLLALYRVEVCLPAAREVLAGGRRRIVAIFDHVKVVEVSEETLRAVDPELRSLVNVNTPADLLDARESVATRQRATSSAERIEPAVETISAQQAREVVLGLVRPLPSERVGLLEALGRVLAEDVTSGPDDADVIDGCEEVCAGDVVLSVGEVLDATAIGLLACAGHSVVAVRRRPRVAVLSTGSELVEVAEKPGPGKIRNSNSYSVAAQVLGAGGVPVRYGIVPDDVDATRAAFELAARECDFILTTGGGSRGDFDFVRRVFEEMGQLASCVVKMRPGDPQAMGAIDDVPFFGLPGNPTSAYTGFEVFVRPALRAMQGFSAIDRPVMLARLSHEVTKKRDRRYYLRGRVERQAVGGALTVSIVGGQSSSLLSAAHLGNCLVIVPDSDGTLPAGTQVQCVRLDMEEGTP